MIRIMFIAAIFAVVASTSAWSVEPTPNEEEQRDLDLIPIDTGNSPELEPGRICTNAQAGYRKAKWKVVIRQPGYTASVVRSTGPVEPRLPFTHKQNGDVVEYTWDASATGEYKLTAWLEQDLSVTVTKAEKAFEFTLTVNPETEGVAISVTAHPAGAASKTDSQPNTITKSVLAATNPSGLFSKKVQASSIGCDVSGNNWFGNISRSIVASLNLAGWSAGLSLGPISVAYQVSGTGEGAKAGAVVKVALTNADSNIPQDEGPTSDNSIAIFGLAATAAVGGGPLASVLAPKVRTFDFSSGLTKIYAYGARAVYAGAANSNFGADTSLIGGTLSVTTDATYLIKP